MHIEAFSRREKEVKPIRIARAVCVAPISFIELSNKLNSGVPISEVTLSEALLIRKSRKSKPSAGIVMPIGGNVLPGETTFQAMLREVGEETTFVSFNDNDSPQRRQHPSYTFKIPGRRLKIFDHRYKEPRDIEMFVLPVQSRSFNDQIPREGFNGREDKISDVVYLSPAELRRLVRNGSLGEGNNVVHAAGHFTMSDKTSISITEDNKLKRNEALEEVLSDVDEFEKHLRNATLKAVNGLKRFKGEEEIEDLGDATPNEITTGFVAAQMRMALSDGRDREREGAQLPPPKADLLKVLPYLAIVPPDMLPDLLLSSPTQEVTDGLLKLEKGFEKSVKFLIDHLQLDQVKLGQILEMSSIDALKAVWSDYNKLPLSDRNSLTKKLDNLVIEGIAEGNIGTDEEDVREAFKTMGSFHSYITDDLKKQKENEFEIYQEHYPMTAILNAGLFTHMVIALGLYPDVRDTDFDGNDTDTLRILRFEAMRSLAVFSVAMETSKLLKEANNSLFQSAFNTFFDFPPQREQINLGRSIVHNVSRRTVKTSGLEVLEDEREKKRPESAARKAFQAGEDIEMLDAYSMNFVLTDNNFKGSSDTLEARLQAAEKFREDMLTHIKQELGLPTDSERVSIIPGTHKLASYDRAREALRGVVQSEYGGARVGSKGDAIIRDKFIIGIDMGDGSPKFLEVCIYPFQNIDKEKFPQLEKAGLWGFAEKLIDGEDYAARRLLGREKDHPTKPSLYELFYQGVLYRNLSERMRRKHILKRGNGNGNGSHLSEAA